MVDPLLILKLTVAKHSILTKKITDLLSPGKVQLLTSGDSMEAIAANPTSTTAQEEQECGLTVLRDLRAMDGKMQAALPLITAVQDQSADAEKIISAIDRCTEANLKIPRSIKELALKRSCTKSLENSDIATWLLLLSFKSETGNIKRKHNLHWASDGESKAAEELQDTILVSKLVDMLRSADLNDEVRFMTGFSEVMEQIVSGPNSLNILSDKLRTEVSDLEKLVSGFGQGGEWNGDFEEVDRIRKTVCSNQQHRFFKPLTLLPGGIAITAQLDKILTQRSKDDQCEKEIEKCVAMMKEIAMYTSAGDDVLELNIPERRQYEELRGLYKSVTERSSSALKEKYAQQLTDIAEFFFSLGEVISKDVKAWP